MPIVSVLKYLLRNWINSDLQILWLFCSTWGGVPSVIYQFSCFNCSSVNLKICSCTLIKSRKFQVKFSKLVWSGTINYFHKIKTQPLLRAELFYYRRKSLIKYLRRLSGWIFVFGIVASKFAHYQCLFVVL